MVSHDFGSDSGIAYIDHAKYTPHETKGVWQTTTTDGWKPDHRLELTRSKFSLSSFRTLHARRGKKINLINPRESFQLYNGLRVPNVNIDATKISQAFHF